MASSSGYRRDPGAAHAQLLAHGPGLGGVHAERDLAARRQQLVQRGVDTESVRSDLDHIYVAGAAEESLAHDTLPGDARRRPAAELQHLGPHDHRDRLAGGEVV